MKRRQWPHFEWPRFNPTLLTALLAGVSAAVLLAG